MGNSQHSDSTSLRTDRRTGQPAHVPADFYREAIAALPIETVWAAAADGEFRAFGEGDLRGVLHHDGAILRFTTWGHQQRFAGAPMEFKWELVDGTLRILHRDQQCWFKNLAPLQTLLDESPSFAPPENTDLMLALTEWMSTWA